MTQEEKAKRYDEAIKKAKNTIEVNQTIPDIVECVESLFPELKESEGERISKEILQFLKENPDAGKLDTAQYSMWIDWLEKQGEQKPTVIIPKFRVGDEIKTSNEESLTITKIDEKGYWSEDLFICGFDEECKWELVEQKPAWSEEDETMLKRVIDFIPQCMTSHGYNEYINWFKDLKNRVQPQPKQEWSEEEEKTLNEFIESLRYCHGKGYDKQINWLKSLRPQNTWKPSDEQMKALSIAMCGVNDPLFLLYQDLLKLKE